MKPTYLILAALVLSGCCDRQYRCGTVVSKFQSGRFNEYYHLGIVSNGYTYVAEVGQLRWAGVKEGDEFCGNIGPCQ